MPYVENQWEFSERQDCASIHAGTRLLFENGAQWWGNRGSDPPVDPHTLNALRLEYLQAKAAAKVASFKKIRQAVATQAQYHEMGAGPHPDAAFPNWQQDLVKLATEIESLQEEAATLMESQRDQLRPQFTDKKRVRDKQRNDAKQVLAELGKLPSF